MSIVLSHSSLSASKASNSGAMKMLAQKGLTGLSGSQQQKFYGVLKENKGNVAKTLGVLNKLKNDGISSEKVFKIKRALGERIDYSGYKKEISPTQASQGGNSSNVVPFRRNLVSQSANPATSLSARLAKINSAVVRHGGIAKAA